MTSDQTGPYLITKEFWRYDVNAHRVELPSGLVAAFDAEGALSSITDPFGNEVTLTHAPASGSEPARTTITQELGEHSRELILINDGAGGNIGQAVSEGRVWHYFWEVEGPVLQITRAQPPEGPSWMFRYQDLSLKDVTTPQGGTVSYSYGFHQFWRDAIGHPRIFVNSQVLSARATSGPDIAPGTWQFVFDSTRRQQAND